MSYQYPVELHSHTHHSDGSFTVAELVQAAIDFGYKGLILTDHNTSSGYMEMRELDAVIKKDITTLNGMEWTTYFGHMLVHDADYDVDWREATVDTIDEYMKEVRVANGLVGIAHPFDMGSPICTGCHWDFQVKDYNLVNYIEIWNSNQPQDKSESILAYEFWLDKLRKGYEISCSTGRDWHRLDTPEANMGVIYLDIENAVLSACNFKEALRQGRYYITLGPILSLQVQQGDQSFRMGDRIDQGDFVGSQIQVGLNPTEITALQAFPVDNAQVIIWNNDDVIYQSEMIDHLNKAWEVALPLANGLHKGYLRVEVRADYRSVKNTLVLVGNPIYIK